MQSMVYFVLLCSMLTTVHCVCLLIWAWRILLLIYIPSRCCSSGRGL